MSRGKRAAGMIFLAPENLSVKQAATKKFIEEPKALAENEGLSPDVMNIKTMDYDNTMFRVKVMGDAPKVMTVSLESEAMPHFVKHGGQAMLDKLYGNFKPVHEGNTVTITVDGDNLGEDVESAVEKISLLKRHLFAAPVEKAVDDALGGGAAWDCHIPYRRLGGMWIKSAKQNVQVTTAMWFEDRTDRALLKIFLQEMKDALRKVPGAPSVEWGASAKSGLGDRDVDIGAPAEEVLYVSLSCGPRHLTKPAQRRLSIDLLVGFRAYLHYHIKCSKAYLHSRMRAKVTEFQKILQRAKPGVGKKGKKRNI